METFSHYWPFVRGIHRSPVNSPHKGQWRGALMFSLICAWINGWVNNREAGDLRRHYAHYDVTVILGWGQKEQDKVSLIPHIRHMLGISLSETKFEVQHIDPVINVSDCFTMNLLPSRYRDTPWTFEIRKYIHHHVSMYCISYRHQYPLWFTPLWCGDTPGATCCSTESSLV